MVESGSPDSPRKRASRERLGFSLCSDEDTRTASSPTPAGLSSKAKTIPSQVPQGRPKIAQHGSPHLRTVLGKKTNKNPQSRKDD